MSTTIRPEPSPKNRYWIDKHRYYELKHFCMQYPLWKKQLMQLSALNSISIVETGDKSNSIARPTEDLAEKIAALTLKIDMVNKAAKDTDKIYGVYIFRAVVDGYSYEAIKMRYDLDCSKDKYYDLYRRFFWLLDKARL